MFKIRDDNTVVIDYPYFPRKITGTRFATVLGLNKYATPFSAWAYMTRIWDEPFRETKYTRAGKAIEPKQISYMKEKYAKSTIRTPVEEFGEDYFSWTSGDFFPTNSYYGGMWDCYFVGKDGKSAVAVGEMKTTKRAEYLRGENVPESNVLQASLYAKLMGVEHACLTYSLLDDSAYENPDGYVPNDGNTRTLWFKPLDMVSNFEDMYKYGIEWYRKHVEEGISPEFDPKRDAGVLVDLRRQIDESRLKVEEQLRNAQERYCGEMG